MSLILIEELLSIFDHCVSDEAESQHITSDEGTESLPSLVTESISPCSELSFDTNVERAGLDLAFSEEEDGISNERYIVLRFNNTDYYREASGRHSDASILLRNNTQNG